MKGSQAESTKERNHGIALKSYRQLSVFLTRFLVQNSERTNEVINHEEKIHILGGCRPLHGGELPDAAADDSEPTGDGDSNSLESCPIRNELSNGERNSSFDERHPACIPGTSSARHLSDGIHDWCEGLRPTEDIHCDLPARRHGLLRCCGPLTVATIQ